MEYQKIFLKKSCQQTLIADSPEYDLKHISKEEADKMISNLEKSRHVRLNRCYSNMNKKYMNIREKKIMDIDPNTFTKDKILKRPGVILHIDGDAEYAKKSREIYKNMGITAYTYNIAESEQYKQIYSLLQKIRPNILILTGHDAFMRRRNDIYNIDNYKNSKYYIQAVLEARKYEHNLDNLVIFAGACQSYYEAILTAGANFASAPKRVLIDMMDPIIVAQTIAYTPVEEFVPLENILTNTREGLDGIRWITNKRPIQNGNARTMK